MAMIKAQKVEPLVISDAPIPDKAPTSIKPSAPSAKTPVRSIMIKPNAASAKGTAKSGILPIQLAIIFISPALPVYGEYGDE